MIKKIVKPELTEKQKAEAHAFDTQSCLKLAETILVAARRDYVEWMVTKLIFEKRYGCTWWEYTEAQKDRIDDIEKRLKIFGGFFKTDLFNACVCGKISSKEIVAELYAVAKALADRDYENYKDVIMEQEYTYEFKMVHRTFAHADDLCHSCGKKLESFELGKRTCSKCREIQRERNRKVADERKEKGLCIKCGNPNPRAGERFVCPDCIDKARRARIARSKKLL